MILRIAGVAGEAHGCAGLNKEVDRFGVFAFFEKGFYVRPDIRLFGGVVLDRGGVFCAAVYEIDMELFDGHG